MKKISKIVIIIAVAMGLSLAMPAMEPLFNWIVNNTYVSLPLLIVAFIGVNFVEKKLKKDE